MRVGDQVVLTKAMLGTDIGTIGYVFAEYPDFDKKGGMGVQIIFENGEYDGFSLWEQGAYLRFVRHIKQYEDYIFLNVVEVARDYRKGFWAF